MGINIYPESPIISLCSSPRISFSHDLADHNTNTNSTPTAIRSDHTLIQNFNTSQDDDGVYNCSSSSLDIVDFNFCVPASGFDQQFISPADQLFSGGMIIPTDDNNNNPKQQQQQQQQQSLEKMMNKKKVVTLNSSIPKPNSNSINPSPRDNNNDIGDKTRENSSSSATKSKSKSKSTAKGSGESTGAAVMLIREEKSNTSSAAAAAAAAAAGGSGGSSSSSKSSSSSSTSFWGFKRSSSCNCDGGNYQTKKSSIWSALPLLARSNSTGSSPKHTSNKANSSTSSSSSSTTTNSTTSSTSNKHLMKSLSLTSNLSVNQNGKPPPRKSSSSGSYHHQQGSGGALMSMNGNGSVLNVPPPYIIKGTSDLLGLGSLFRNGNVNKDKKSSSNKKR